jgi:adenylate cyclase
MSFEIERKFLVRGGGWQQLVNDRTAIRQAYLASSAKSSVRVRIKERKAATLTVKSRPFADLEHSI